MNWVMVVVYTDRACGRIVDFSSKPSCDLTLTHKVVAPIPSLTIVSIESDNSDVEIVLQDEEDDDTSEKKWAHVDGTAASWKWQPRAVPLARPSYHFPVTVL